MRAEPADERDSSREVDNARYRIYLFDGPGNAVTTIDVLETSVEEALDAALVESGNNRRLWSLALVHDDGGAGRGLVWLSGNDYNSPPDAWNDSASYWRSRGGMQSRYLLARSLAGEPVVLPTGVRSIRMFPEWSVDLPLWESFTDNYPVTRGVFRLSADLEDDLAAWNERWQAIADPDASPEATAAEWTTWENEGRLLLARLRTTLAGIAEVRPEFLLSR